MGIFSVPQKDLLWDSLHREVWDMESVQSARLFESNFSGQSTASFVAKLIYPHGRLRATQGFGLLSPNRQIEGATTIDLPNPQFTLRLMKKPSEVVAHVDFGLFALSRKYASVYSILQPYITVSSDRTFGQHVFSFGNFLATSNELYSHFRASIPLQSSASELHIQHNLVQSFAGITFNHLLTGAVGGNGIHLGHTLNLLSTYKRLQMRLAVDAHQFDRCGNRRSEIRATLGYFLAPSCIIAINHTQSLNGRIQLTEVGLGLRSEVGAELKVKAGTDRTYHAVVKQRVSTLLTLRAGVSGRWDGGRIVGALDRLPFLLNLSLCFKPST